MNQLASGDPIGDLSTSSSSLSTKGAQGRAKLQQELAAHRGLFFQSVIQSMARRMQPARPADLSPQELAARGICPTAYSERFGGYGKARELGCLQWQVMMLLDHLQNDNFPAAKDIAALLAVCVEQSAMDGGRLDIGMLLSLSEDPPSGVFQQRWVTIALAYIKEMDLIASKRIDAAGGKANDKDQPNPQQPNPKKPPKKGAKGGGKQKQSSQQEEE